jgi:hypothetical protein
MTPKDQPPTKPQRDRFIEAAREAGADETGEAFERAFDVLVSQPPPVDPDIAPSTPAVRPGHKTGRV